VVVHPTPTHVEKFEGGPKFIPYDEQRSRVCWPCRSSTHAGHALTDLARNGASPTGKTRWKANS
jgi:hypothetical protein